MGTANRLTYRIKAETDGLSQRQSSAVLPPCCQRPIVFALPVAIPFRRHRNWQTVFLLFGFVQLQSDHRRHMLICRRVQRRYSSTRRHWIWTVPNRPHVDLSAASQP